MNRPTKQMETWSGDFGKQYTDRNTMSLDEMEALYKRDLGVTRMEMNLEFIGDLDRDVRILEVGSNIGLQLELLQRMGFRNLYGIELQEYAVELAQKRTKGLNVIQGTAFDIPFKDGFFDLVFTSGVLIHISPQDIYKALDEINRCARLYVWGMEYYAQEYQEIFYRGHTELLWKTDFPRLYLNRFRTMELVRSRYFKYLADDNVDVMYLLRKRE